MKEKRQHLEKKQIEIKGSFVKQYFSGIDFINSFTDYYFILFIYCKMHILILKRILSVGGGVQEN
jgi:hypothetical protein